MSRQCPNCQKPLGEFAFKCEHCDWSISNPLGSDDGIEEQLLEIDLHVDRALQAIEQEDFPSALVFLNRAIVDAPPERLAECYSLRGYVHLKNLDFARAESDCTHAIERHWHEAQTFAWRAAARGEQNKWRLAFDDLEDACRVAGNQRDQYLQLMTSYLKSASDHFRTQIKAGKDNADMFFDRGWIYFQAGKYDKAERDFRNALHLDNKHSWACLGLARCRLQDTKLDGEKLAEVIRLCNIAVKGDQHCKKSALRIRARAHHRVGEVTRASKDLKQLRSLGDEDPRELIDLGELRFELGDCVEAIGDFTTALSLNPDLHIALVRRADCYEKIRNYSLAIEDYGRFLRFYPNDLDTRVKRGQVYLKTNKLQKAADDFERALIIEKTCFDAYLGRAQICFSEHQLDQALTECQKAVRLDNQHPEAYATLADIYHQLCDYTRSIDEFSRAVQLAHEPELKAQYLYRRGAAYYELSKFALALKDFSQATKLRPNHPGTWIWKAAACSRLEKWPKAILGLQQAIALRPSAAEQYQELGRPVAERAIEYFNHQQQRGHTEFTLFRSRGLARQFLGEFENAIDDYTSALNIQEGSADVLIRRGQCFANLKDHEKAIKDFTRVIKDDDANHWARYNRAMSRQMKGQLQESLSDVLKAIKLAPNQPRYHVLHGELVQKQGNWSKMIKAFDRALRMDPTDPQTYRRRGAAHLQTKQFLKAISDFTRSLELSGNQPEVRIQRGQAYLRDGQLKAAIEDFEGALSSNEKLSKAYSGRAAVLAAQDRHEYALQWLTKALHRFSLPSDVAEILFARGKIFYQMKRFEPAIADFNSVVELLRGDNARVLAVRIARGITWVQVNELETAKQDFLRVLRIDPANEQAKIALKWLADPTVSRPSMFAAPKDQIRPTRPPVVGNSVHLIPQPKFNSSAPYDTWILRVDAKKEYGPIPKKTLDLWVREGRAVIGMKVLRADWSKWKRIEKIYPELDPSPEVIASFPQLELRRKREATESENGDEPDDEPVLPNIQTGGQQITDLPVIIDKPVVED